jgi:DNA-binding IclR family transcriptional regulator
MTPTQLPRRVFLLRTAAGASLLAAAGASQAQAQVEETDETAVALGYKRDTTKVDAKKYATHTAEQKCKNCSFWQGAATDANAGCAMFGRKQVAANGWCLSYKKVG